MEIPVHAPLEPFTVIFTAFAAVVSVAVHTGADMLVYSDVNVCEPEPEESVAIPELMPFAPSEAIIPPAPLLVKAVPDPIMRELIRH